MIRPKPVVLVHGSWHANWVWDKITPVLQSRNFKVVAPSLPGHDLTAFDISKMTQEGYVEAVSECVSREEEPVLLVGHSQGGMVITQVAENLPDRVRHLVYVTAMLPKNGQSSFTLLTEMGFEGGPWYDISADGSAAVPKIDVASEAFYSDCDESVAQWAVERLRDQGLKPTMVPVSLTDENYGRVPKTYIVCTQDRALRPEWQKRMIAEVPGFLVLELDAGHSPMLSQPQALADMLCGI